MLIFDVYTDGEVRQNNGTYSYSYGSPSTGWDWPNAVYVIPSGTLDMEWAVTRSYGLSPNTGSISRSWTVYLGGDIYRNLVGNSYGHKNTGVKS